MTILKGYPSLTEKYRVKLLEVSLPFYIPDDFP
jgi:hypothetical protein